MVDKSSRLSSLNTDVELIGDGKFGKKVGIQIQKSCTYLNMHQGSHTIHKGWKHYENIYGSCGKLDQTAKLSGWCK